MSKSWLPQASSVGSSFRSYVNTASAFSLQDWISNQPSATRKTINTALACTGAAATTTTAWLADRYVSSFLPVSESTVSSAISTIIGGAMGFTAASGAYRYLKGRSDRYLESNSKDEEDEEEQSQQSAIRDMASGTLGMVTAAGLYGVGGMSAVTSAMCGAGALALAWGQLS